VLLCLLAVGAGRAGPTAEQVSRYQALDARELRTFTNVELAEYLALRQQVAPPVSAGNEVGRCAVKSVGSPFRLHACRYDLSESDWVTFVERMIAMGCAKDWETYYRILSRLRTRDGSDDFLSRNFFTLADWVPNNTWLLEDITEKLGVSVERFTDVVRRKAFYARLRFGQDDTEQGRAKAAALAAKVAAAPELERHEVSYIHRDRLPSVLSNLRTGDVCLVIRRVIGSCKSNVIPLRMPTYGV